MSGDKKQDGETAAPDAEASQGAQRNESWTDDSWRATSDATDIPAESAHSETPPAQREDEAVEPDFARASDDWSRARDALETEAVSDEAERTEAAAQSETAQPETAQPETAQHEPIEEAPVAEAPVAEEPTKPHGQPAVARAATAPQPEQRSDQHSGGFASKALAALVLLIAGAALAVWGGPKVAPMLPASLAGYLTPAGAGVDPATVAALGAEIASLKAAVAAADARATDAGASAEAALAAAGGVTDRLAEIDAAVAGLAQRVEAAPAGASDAAEGDPALAGRLAETETALKELRAELAAAPTGAGGGADALAAVRAALAARIDAQSADLAALSARVAALDPAMADLSGQLAALAPTVKTLDGRLAALETGLEQTADAESAATLALALATVERAMMTGAPFAAALEKATSAVDAPPPAALSAAAASGAATPEALAAAFTPAAYDALNAAVEAEAAEGGGLFSGVLAKVEARVTGLPTTAIAGDDPQAVLSRARAAVETFDFETALAEIGALPAPAQDAMAQWTADARLRIEADAALAAWRDALDAR